MVRRVLAARTTDQHLIEDLTQETIVRVAAVQGRLEADGLHGYAVATAKNLLASHGRNESIKGRHAHRLVDYTHHDGPEHLTLEQEETDALATALEKLDDEERQLLVRHEVEGVELADLARERMTSTGAIAMRLARARAMLRLEFLLAFRHVTLPNHRCRNVLIALSAGDRRRQEALRAADHLRDCTTCTSLAPAVTERNRKIAGWILLPVAEGMRRAWRAVRSHPAHAAAAVGAATVIGIAAIALPDGPRAASPPSATASQTPAPQPAGTTSPITQLPSPPIEVAPPTAASASTMACPPPGPLDQLDASTAVGCTVAATTLTVTAVPADEGFWAVTTAHQPVWVQLIGSGESPMSLQAGHQVVVTGTIRSPSEPVLDRGLPPHGAENQPPYQLDVAYADLQAAT